MERTRLGARRHSGSTEPAPVQAIGLHGLRATRCLRSVVRFPVRKPVIEGV
jgi:hypothetical protein